MNVLLASPPVFSVPRPEGTLPGWVSSPPLGIASLTRVLRDRGHDAVARDYCRAAWPEVERDLAAVAPAVLGIACFTERRGAARELARRARQLNPRLIIVMGGAHATLYPEAVLNHYDADYVVRGEGEATLAELIDRLAAGGDGTGVAGVSWVQNGAVVNHPDRPLITDLDGLPELDYALFPPDRYAGDYLLGRGTLDGREVGTLPRATLVSSRGCVYHCQYCATTRFWQNRIRYRTVPNVVDEMARLHREHGVACFTFADDAFTLDPRRVLAFCDELHRRQLRVAWSCIGRVTGTTPELFVRMKAAGCFLVTFGAESGSARILKAIGKQATPGDILTAFAQSGAAGLFREMLLMVGNPGETRATIAETLAVLRQARPDEVAVNLTTVYPGTALYDRARREGLLDDEYWLNDLAAPYYTVEHRYPWLVRQGGRIIRAFLEMKGERRRARQLRWREGRDLVAYHTGLRFGRGGIELIPRRTGLTDSWL